MSIPPIRIERCDACKGTGAGFTGNRACGERGNEIETIRRSDSRLSSNDNSTPIQSSFHAPSHCGENHFSGDWIELRLR